MNYTHGFVGRRARNGSVIKHESEDLNSTKVIVEESFGRDNWIRNASRSISFFSFPVFVFAMLADWNLTSFYRHSTNDRVKKSIMNVTTKNNEFRVAEDRQNHFQAICLKRLILSNEIINNLESWILHWYTFKL